MRYAGVDEVGVGALAGPICAAAVAADVDVPFVELRRWWPIAGVRDSKKTTRTQRETLYPRLMDFLLRVGASVGFSAVPPIDINTLGHSRALEDAKVWAVQQVMEDDPVDLLIVDGSIRLPPRAVKYVEQRVLPKADTMYWLVAAASIVAKVRRDQAMADLSRQFPSYEFDRNMGYGTAGHVHALRTYGPSSVHRDGAVRTAIDHALARSHSTS